MILIPQPKNLVKKEGSFIPDFDTVIVLLDGCTASDFNTAKEIKSAFDKYLHINPSIIKAYKKEEGSAIYLTKSEDIKEEAYKLEITENEIVIVAGTDSGTFYGAMTLLQIIKSGRLECLYIEDEPQFKVRGYLQDITRGKIPTLENLKRLADKLSEYKYNHMQIYVEHSFAFRKQKCMWNDADPITAEEILELDAYCKTRHIELVPCMATFGHLYTSLQYNTEYRELDSFGYEVEFSFIDRIFHNTLNVSNEDSFKFICDAIDEFLPLFSSNKFNICGDETHDLCKDKSKKLLEDSDVGKIYTDFVKKIINHVNSRGKKAMMWGDIIRNYPQYLEDFPEDIIFLNWLYEADPDEKITEMFAKTGKTQYVCSATRSWNKFVNDLDTSFKNIKNLYLQGKKYGAEGILNTDWGDYGHIALTANSLPSIIYGGSMAWNTDGDMDIEEAMEKISIVEYGNPDIVVLMKKIGNSVAIQWSDFMNWYEWYFIEKRIVDDKDPNAVNTFMSKDIADVQASYESLKNQKTQLLSIASEIENERCFKELFVGINGNILLQLLYLNIRGVLTKNAKELADEFDSWFYEYSKIWRLYNKESELFRLKRVIKHITEFLRKQ